MNRRKFLVSGLYTTAVALSACAPRQKGSQDPFQGDSLDYVMSIVLDLSGSYYDRLLGSDGKAYRFCMKLMDKFWRNRMGDNDRIVISQISAKARATLWDGHPDSLRKTFNAATFKNFLVEKSDAASSRVHESIADTIEYTLLAYGGKKTRRVLCIFSDMLDNFPDSAKTEKRLVEQMRELGKEGGGVGIYWIDAALMRKWYDNLNEAGIKHKVIQADIVVDPDLPSFEN